MSSFCVSGKLLGILYAIFHLILAITIRRGDISNSTLRKLRFSQDHSRTGVLIQALLTLKPALSTTMFSFSHDHQDLYLADRGSGGQDPYKGSGNRQKLFLERLKLGICQPRSQSVFTGHFWSQNSFVKIKVSSSKSWNWTASRGREK